MPRVLPLGAEFEASWVDDKSTCNDQHITRYRVIGHRRSLSKGIMEMIKPVLWRDRKCLKITCAKLDMYGALVLDAEWEGEPLRDTYSEQLAKIGVSNVEI